MIFKNKIENTFVIQRSKRLLHFALTSPLSFCLPSIYCKHRGRNEFITQIFKFFLFCGTQIKIFSNLQHLLLTRRLCYHTSTRRYCVVTLQKSFCGLTNMCLNMLLRRRDIFFLQFLVRKCVVTSYFFSLFKRRECFPLVKVCVLPLHYYSYYIFIQQQTTKIKKILIVIV